MMDWSRLPESAELDELIDRALALDPADRPAFVQTTASRNPALADALAAILREDSADGFLPPGGALSGALASEVAQSLDDAEETPGLHTGQTFGTYEVTGVLGRGGMGEVYRARDTRLGRDVALKVLPARFARDEARGDRLRQEARVLAALNDPCIAGIHDLEEHDGISALVLEFVDGETLAERMTRGRIPFAEVLAIAEQVARGLRAAHQRGIVHRDLKPGNIKIGAAGDVKILDFGIAQVISDEPEDGAPVFDPALRPVAGTPSYVAPERLERGRSDQREDLWAFGCVLYEMLSGQRAFDGGSPPATLSQVLRGEPDWTRLPARTPASLRRLLDRLLRKDPDRRLGFAGDALLDLDEARQELAADPTPRVHRRPVSRGLLSVVLVAGVALGALAVWVSGRGDLTPPMHLALPLAPEDDLVAGELPGLAISPDGRTVVYRSRRQGVIQLVRRSLGQPAGVAIEGSENGASPFFSPDGQWIAFANDSGIFKVPAGGGKPVPVAEATGGARATWASDGSIWFSTGSTRVIHRLAAEGGPPQPVTRLDEAAGELTHEGPSALPGEPLALLTVTTRDGARVGIADMPSGRVAALTPGRQPVAIGRDAFIFVRGDGLWLARLDASRMALDGEPSPVLTGLELGALSQTAHFGVSSTGTLIYMPRHATADDRLPIWLGRDGRETPLPIDPRPYTRASVSPDGGRIALASASADNRDIWIFEAARAQLMRLTTNPATDTAPVWSPDGKFIAFRSDRDGGGIYLTRSDGSGDARRLTRADGPSRPAHTPYSFTPDGLTLLFGELRSYSDQGISAVTLSDPPVTQVVLDGPAAEARPAISPNGQWLAYQSDESGRFEVYIRPYPDVKAARVQVSVGAGTSPRWAADGSALFFFDGTAIASVTVQPGQPIAVSAPVTVVDAARFNERLGPVYDPSPDGRSFLFLRPAQTGGAVLRRELMVVTGWRDSVLR